MDLKLIQYFKQNRLLFFVTDKAFRDTEASRSHEQLFVLPNAHYLWYASHYGHYIEHRVRVLSTGPVQFLKRRLSFQHQVSGK